MSACDTSRSTDQGMKSMAKAKPKRNVGRDILADLHQLERGGALSMFRRWPQFASALAFRRPGSPRCLAHRCALCRSGSRGAARPQVAAKNPQTLLQVA